ncbi:MAG: hypothetical protein RI907_866 [Pseudomonadota bacterium]|jgi:L-threonylcarbamoyladenylate synthase
MRLLDPEQQPDAIEQAAERLQAGGLVAMPTETVYGLAANASDDAAVARIFAAKGRPADHPLIVHVVNLYAAFGFVDAFPPVAQRLAEAFWPGPLTVIVPRKPGVAGAAAGGQDTIGLRCPDHPVAQALLQACAERDVMGLAAPSANRFGRISPTLSAHVVEEFETQGEGLDEVWVLEGGASDVGIESTIVDCSREQPVLLRPGRLTLAEIEAVVGGPVAWSRPEAPDPAAPRASGTLLSHYAPRAKLRLLSSEQLALELDTAERRMEGVDAIVRAAASGERHHLGVYSRSLWAWHRPHEGVVHRSMPGDAVTAAHDLFADLRELDAHGVGEIWVEAPPDDPAWDGVRDRLLRAAAA